MNSSIIEGSSRFVNGKIPGEARRPGNVNEGEKQLEIGRKVAYNDAVNRSYVHPEYLLTVVPETAYESWNGISQDINRRR